VKIATIGIYGWTLERFLGALRAADVRVVLDVRQRRGVRGPEYAWANSLRIQATGRPHDLLVAPTGRPT
jgi:hypothetical protein